MLVLARREQEEIIVTSPQGEELRILVVEIRPGLVRLGLNAPRTWVINRAEIQARIEAKGEGRK